MRRRSISMLILATAWVLLTCACDEDGKGFAVNEGSTVGVWAITGELVTTSSEVANTPNEGSIWFDEWTVTKTPTGLLMTTPKGSLPGAATASGATFFAEGPLAAGVIISVQIDIYMDSATSFYGTEEIQYTGTNVVTGALIPLGMEAWKVWGELK